MAAKKPTRRKVDSSEAYDEYREYEEVNREFSNHLSVKLSDKQYELFNGIRDSRIISIIGPPGTSKTFTACYAAVKALQKGEVKRIVLVKPLETSGEDLGFLPGTEKDKIAPFFESFMDNLLEMVDPKTLKMWIDNGTIRMQPIAYMRGRTFKHSFIICDEMQNADIKQLMTTITRFGQGSKIAIIGDSRQNDINEKYVALDFFIEKILGEDEQMFHFRFERADIVRDPLLIKIIDNYEMALASGEIPSTKRKN
jgi:phosphate starvation-inducible PhoH-like protein